MRSRWFHKPVFHTALGHEKKVTWIELFFDLIFVAGIIQLGDGLSAGITDHLGWVAVGHFALHFAPLLMAWMGFTFYANRFDHDDIAQRLLVFGMMFAMGAMAITGPVAKGPGDITPELFSGAFAISQALIAIMYVRVWRHTPEARQYATYWGSVFAIGAVIAGVSIFLPDGWCEAAIILAILVILGAPAAKASREIQNLFPIDQEHLAERFGLLTIIVLGESFVKVLSYLNEMPPGEEWAYLLKGAQNLMITCALWWVYFDDVAHSHVKKGKGNWVIWLYAHVPLMISVTGLGVALKKALSFEAAVPPGADYRWLMAGMLAAVLLSVAIIDSVTERAHAEASDRFRLHSRVAGAMVVLVLAPAGGAMSSLTFLLLLTGICVALVAFDLLIAPLMHSEEEEFSMEQHKERLAQKQAEGKPSKRVDVRDAVRKGAPAAMRQDFYYFFMEGSWTRLFLVFGGIFLLLNVFFAGLYLLEPGGISGGMGNFEEAFAFSVQTMSTIGYGEMSPITPYADLIVTIEAAVSIIMVAVGTGVIFAKISRASAAVVFSKNILVTRFDDEPALIFRVGNARGNELVDASVSVTVIREHVTAEGEHMRRMMDLKLVRSRSPFFALSWTVYHVIDEDSPVADVDFSDVENSGITAVIVTLMGHDSTYGDTAHARHMYYVEDFLSGHRFGDVISFLEDGRLVVDYSKIHDVEPIAPGESVEPEPIDDAEAGEEEPESAPA